MEIVKEEDTVLMPNMNLDNLFVASTQNMDELGENDSDPIKDVKGTFRYVQRGGRFKSYFRTGRSQEL